MKENFNDMSKFRFEVPQDFLNVWNDLYKSAGVKLSDFKTLVLSDEEYNWEIIVPKDFDPIDRLNELTGIKLY
jgi:hypothetical protein